MDERRFDAMTRQLARETSRRQLVRRGAAGLAGAILPNLRRARSLADNAACAQFCQQLPPGLLRGQCVSDAAQGVGLCYQCGPGAPAGTSQRLCGTTCADTASDPGNCGGCGSACPAGQACLNGACGCPGGTTPCGEGCVEQCSGGLILVEETCTCGCPATCGGMCTDLFTDPANCGACGYACPPPGDDAVLAYCRHGNCCTSDGTYCACAPTGSVCEFGTCCQIGLVCPSSGNCP